MYDVTRVNKIRNKYIKRNLDVINTDKKMRIDWDGLGVLREDIMII